MNTICKRRCTHCGIGKIQIGAPGMICPRCGHPFEDTPITWRTQSPLCPRCGEVIGTTRKRHKYDYNRFPATVRALECEDCGTPMCEACYSGFRTQEVSGSYRHRTEGGHWINRPRYRHAILCKPCYDKRVAAREEAKNATQFKCPGCGYIGRRDSFKMGRTLDGREYVKGCPECGFSWTPSIIGILASPEQKRIVMMRGDK